MESGGRAFVTTRPTPFTRYSTLRSAASGLRAVGSEPVPQSAPSPHDDIDGESLATTTLRIALTAIEEQRQPDGTRPALFYEPSE